MRSLLLIKDRLNDTDELGIVTDYMPQSRIKNSSRLVHGTQQWVRVKVASTFTRSQSQRASFGYSGSGESNPGSATNQHERIVGWHNNNQVQILNNFIF